MRRFLLLTVATLLTISMMAIGTGNGKDKANAIDFRWGDGHDHQAGATLWYQVDLDSISGLVDPTLALYLTNLSDQPAVVSVDVNAKVSYSLPIPGFKPVEKDTTIRANYTIDGKGYELWSQNVKELIKLNVTHLDLKLSSSQNVKLSAKKYETSEIIDIACEDADDFDWKHGKKIVDKHNKNLGLRSHMMSLGKWFNEFDAIVVLEDDIVVSPNFYSYTKQTVKKYHNSQTVAGISLYSIVVNYHTITPFTPLKDEHDVYFMNCAMSWGEVWMRDSWNKFYDWYKEHQEFPMIDSLPRSICSWKQKSWLKYHTRYCIEENKYFVHPYTSLTTNFSDAGEHNNGDSNAMWQVPIQYGDKKSFILPEFGSRAVYYDGFFENIDLYKCLGYTSDELCLDLQGEWNNRLNKRYWLTTEIRDYRIIKSFGLNYRPIELNIINNEKGCQIFLYDTTIIVKNPNKKNRKSFLYRYHLSNMFYFVRSYGFGYALKDFVEAVKKRIK